MVSTADVGYGTLFKIGDGATPTETFTKIGTVINLKPLSVSRDSIDVTHNESANRFREFIPGLRDGGEISFEILLDPDGLDLDTLYNDEFNSQTVGNKKIEFADGSDFTFAGFCTKIDADTPTDDKMTLSVTYKVSGKPVLTQA